MPSNFVAECIDCGHQTPYTITTSNCPKCNGEWRETRYDIESLRQTFSLQLPDRQFNLWRYAELLPVRTPNPELTLGEANEIGELLTEQIDPKAQVIWGSRVDPTFENRVEVISIFTGVHSPYIKGPTNIERNEWVSSSERAKKGKNLGLETI